MNGPEALRAGLFEEAVDWLLRVRAREATPEDLAAWLQWVEADESHRQAFDRALETWDATGAVSMAVASGRAPPPYPPPSAAGPAPVPVRPLPMRPARRRRWPRVAGLALAASLLAAVALPPLQPYLARAWYGATGTASQQIRTAHGEPRAVLLPDGTRVQMGAATGVRLDFTPRQRRVEAAEGEVYYQVKRDRSRPFVVQAGEVTVTAVGTAFAVRREAGNVSVVVTEGVVDIAAGNVTSRPPLRAQAGQRVRYEQGRLVAAAEPPANAPADIDWRPGQLRFEDEPLRVVVASLNRYASRPIELQDAGLGELHFTGTVSQQRTDDWVAAAQRLFPLVAEEHGERIVLRRR